jgi:predicted alpha/beta superfamily hydrolase
MLSVALLALSFQTPQETRVDSLTGNIEPKPAFESKILGNKRDVWVYLPPQYKTEPKRRFPVLYMHDGQNVFSGKTSYLPNKEWRADEAAEALIRANAIQPMIIVAISNAGMDRANEFLPTKIRMGNNEGGGNAKNYGRFLIEEVIPWVNQSYRTMTGPRNTALAGSSFGGVITLFLGATYPKTFGKLGIFSPSVWVNNREPLKIVEGLSGKAAQQIWVDMGGSEGPNSLRDARDLVAAYEKKGWKPGRDLLYYEEGFAQHNEDAWARRLPAMLMFFYRK